MNRALYFAFLALLWIPLFLALIPSWNGGTYYSYGWLVPVAMAFFFARRNQEISKAPRPLAPSPGKFVVVYVIGFLLILGLRILEGGNVHWRLPLWIHSFLTIALTVLTWWLVEGKRAMIHYTPVLLFSLLAIPLPSVMEQGLVQNLTEAVTSTGADLARLLGVQIEISEAAFLINGAPLDVNDGCSGIRSFQSSLMAGLFVGELFRLASPQRVTLLLISMAAAFLGNAIRVVTLIRAYDEGGSERFDAVHDSAGFSSLALCYGIIALAGFLFDRFSDRLEQESISKTESRPATS